jgi:hypothetical protein
MKLRRSNGFLEAKRILARESSAIALLLGNGINRAADSSNGISWDQLMERLITSAAKNSPDPLATERRLKRLLESGKSGRTAASLPEVFDIIEATRSVKPGGGTEPPTRFNLQSEIASMLKDMKPGAPHSALVRWAAQFRIPLLTTNYDHCFQEALGEVTCKRRGFNRRRLHSDVYPWDRYYAPNIISDPAKEFAIWHVHGDRELERSIRAGLDQYMGMVERLRKKKQLIAKEILRGPIEERIDSPAFYDAPWLRVFMGKKLWIQGLALTPAEVSIRWLLIQRFRYWRRYKPECRFNTGWYVHGPTDLVGPLDKERGIFFESVGLHVLAIAKTNNAYINLYRCGESATKQKRLIRNMTARVDAGLHA